MPKNKIMKIANGLYQIKYYWLGVANVYCYAIVGKERALLIDTAYSTARVIDYVKSVTELPITVVNTHGHFDHIGGDGDFDEVYLSDRDLEVAKEHSDYDVLMRILDNAGKKGLMFKLLLLVPKLRKAAQASARISATNYKSMPQSGCFELGGRRVSFIEAPGHTPGSICLFDEQTKTLFPGDMLCERGALLGFDYSSSVTQFKESVLKIEQFYHLNGGERIYPSHHKTPAGDDIFDRYKELCDRIVAGSIEGAAHDDGISSGIKAELNGLALIYKRI